MKKIIIAFDIDWTLRNNEKEYWVGNAIWAVPNEEIRSLLIMLSKFKNIECHIWSGGWKAYAEDIRRKFLLEKYIKESNCHWKFDDDSFVPDIAIDDMHSCELGNINLIVKQK